VFFAFDLLHYDGIALRRTPLLERRTALRKLIEPDCRSPIQFSDHANCDGAKFFKAAADLGLQGIVSKRATSLYGSGRSKNFKTKNMVEQEFVLLGTEYDDSGIPWALLARERDDGLDLADTHRTALQDVIADAEACR
jgi:bifunctional non-homologous end joining protein LigD